MFNESVLIGRIGNLKELKTTENGKNLINFSLATHKTYNKEKITTWHNCTAWNKTADVINQYCKVGDIIAVRGEIVKRKYTVDDQERESVEIRVDKVSFINSTSRDDVPVDGKAVEKTKVESGDLSF